MFIDMLNLPNFNDFNLTSLYTGKDISFFKRQQPPVLLAIRYSYLKCAEKVLNIIFTVFKARNKPESNTADQIEQCDAYSY